MLKCGCTICHPKAAGKCRSHRARDVHQHDGPPWQLLSSSDTLQPGWLQRLLPLRSVARRGEKTEREHTRRADRAKRREHERLVHPDLAHVAQVAEQGERAQLLLAQQTLPGLTLVSTSSEPRSRQQMTDRKSTRLNSSHANISYA